MPYVITTKRPQSQIEPQITWHESRHAVATLEEARGAASLAVMDHEREHGQSGATLTAASTAEHLPESGGTVGPLPDGTVIDVGPRTWEELAHDEQAENWPDTVDADVTEAQAHAAIIDAYNAAQT